MVAYSESQSEPGSAASEHGEKEREKKRVVLLGTGWAGISFLKDLDVSSYDVQVVSPQNYFAFTPLLPSVTCGTVEARSIAEPVRNIIKKVAEAKQEFQKLFTFFFPYAQLESLSVLFDNYLSCCHFLSINGFLVL